jgi:hypothetical protein
MCCKKVNLVIIWSREMDRSSTQAPSDYSSDRGHQRKWLVPVQASKDRPDLAVPRIGRRIQHPPSMLHLLWLIPCSCQWTSMIVLALKL